jgi:hypothetical protein
MSKKPKELYIAICDNEIICFHISLSPFYKEFKKIEPNIKSLSYYQKEFKNTKEIAYTNTQKRKTYYLTLLKS